ncbi:amino acid permease [Candidatus Woesearchaeota archaeon]|nr:amino acid permease [Candidatus Woesearchaeota archaeon]
MLLVATIVEAFYDVAEYYVLIDFFDIFVIAVFALDLYYRKKETPEWGQYLKKHWLDIIATIPFNFIFIGVEGLGFIRALRGVRIIARYGKLLRLARFSARAPRFLRMHKHMKKVPVREVQPHEKEMKGVLSFKVILLVTINSIMGTGIWFLTAAGAKHAGPASLISWGILSVVAVYIAMCFSELTAMFPKAGGVYEFAKQTYGRFWSFVIGWTTSIAGSVTIAMLMLGALQYMIPIKYSGWYIPIAIVLILIFNFIAYRGMQTSTYMLVGFALVTLVTIVSIIIPGFFRFDTANFTPFFVFPAINIMLAIFFIAETFFGWESAIFLSAETKNPKKIMPKALIYGTMVIAGFALLLSLTAMGVIPWAQYAESVAPLRDLGAAYFGGIGIVVFTLLVSVSIIGAVASWIVTAPRLLMALAEDKLFFVHFAKIHPKHKSPYVSIVFQILVLCVLVYIGSGSYEMLLHLLIPLILLLYSAVLMSVVVLRYKKPDMPRPFKVPFGKVGPFFTVVFMAFLMYMFLHETHGAIDLMRVSLSLIAFGIPAYFFIEIFYEQRYVNMRRNLHAHTMYNYHKIPLPRPTFNKIRGLIGDTHKKTVILDYDCGVGGFTRSLIRRKIPFKKIYAVDKAHHQIKVFKKNIPESYKRKITIYERESWRLPKKIRGVDVFVASGSLGYMDDMPAFIKHMKSVMNRKGKFCFYVKNTFVNMTPNALLVSDKQKMLEMFYAEKLVVNYRRRKKMFSEEVFVWGEKR